MRPRLGTDASTEGTCSDCGIMVPQRTRCLDRQTHSALDLCGRCLGAFMQRQQFLAGCCD